MKAATLLLLIIILILSGKSHGNNGNHHPIHSSGGSESSTSSVNSNTNNPSSSAEVGGVHSRSGSTVENSPQTTAEIRTIYEQAARSSGIALSYCQTGAGGSSIDATIVVGDVEFSCKAANTIPQMLSAIPILLKHAESFPVGSPDRIRLKKMALSILDDVYHITGTLLPEYIEDEALFATLWGIFKNIIVPLGVVVLIAL
jgi:hypothetical protein